MYALKYVLHPLIYFDLKLQKDTILSQIRECARGQPQGYNAHTMHAASLVSRLVVL